MFLFFCGKRERAKLVAASLWAYPLVLFSEYLCIVSKLITS